MKTFTHEEVAQRAREIWWLRGQPNGRDNEIWLEAERQLAAGTPGSQAAAVDPVILPVIDEGTDPEFARRVKADMASESAVEFQISPSIPEEDAIRAALQKNQSRAPMRPAKAAPSAVPAATGKPLWSKPHSS